jgi:hypothetical protein
VTLRSIRLLSEAGLFGEGEAGALAE